MAKGARESVGAHAPGEAAVDDDAVRLAASRIRGVALVGVAVAGYAALSALGRSTFGPGLGAAYVGPVLIAAFLFGKRGALPVASAALVLIPLLDLLGGVDVATRGYWLMGVSGFAATILVGAVAGHLKDLRDEHRETVVALARERDRSTTIVEGANALIVGLDAGGRVTTANAPAKRALRLPSDAEDAAAWVDVLARAGASTECVAAVAAALADPERRVIETHLSLGGAPLVVEWRTSRTPRGAGDEASLWFGVDVTERRRTEARLALQARLLEAVGQAVIATDAAGRITYWNRAAEKTYGWSADEVMGRSIMDVAVPDALLADAASIASTLEAGMEWTGEFVVRRKDGSTFPVRVTDSPLLDASGRFVGVIGVSEDITEARRVADALRASEERFRGLVENMADVVVIVDHSGTMEYVSPSAKRVLGHADGSLVGRPFMELVHPDDLESTLEDFTALVAKPGGVRATAFRARHANGSWVHLEATGTNYLHVPQYHGILAVVRDVTERVRIAEEARARSDALARTERLTALGTLVAGVAHEINNPLMYVGGNIELAILDLQAAAIRDADLGATEELLRTALTGTERIGRVAKALRTVAGQTDSPRERTDLADVLQSVEALVRVGTPKNVDATFSGGEGPVFVEANASEIHQVVLNLARNALDAVQAGGGRVSVTLATRDNRAEIVVEDDGPGIPPDVRARVFDPFFTTKTGGTGLGLSIVQTIVREHGGDVTVDTADGRGTTVRVRLPLAPADAP